MHQLFKKNIIREKLADFTIPEQEAKLEVIKKWHNDYHNGSLKTDKEISRAPGWTEDFLGEILDYTRKPAENHTYDTEYSVAGQRPDFVLGYFSSEKNMVIGELKDAKTSLDAPQKREGSVTPVQQAFKYKGGLRDTSFVIVSNFYEIRLYNDNHLDFEVWTLDDLVDSKNDYFNFRKFYFLLSEKNLISKRGESKTKSLLSYTRIQEKEITKQFYREYTQLRKELFKDIISNNPGFKKSELDFLLNKTQKIIDRIIFIHFCEDLGLLPQGKLKEVIAFGEQSLSTTWQTLQNFFRAVDSGSEKLGIPDGYNGGLFHTDQQLNDLKVGDKICNKFVELGEYDFADDLSVNILGHIFEQSISDIEELKDKINKQEEATLSKRKKDGVFYTPEYIVDYIVKNSVGKRVDDWEEELKLTHNLKDDITDTNYNKRAIHVYQELQTKVQNITVVDPACGSGAFLVKVFDFLLAKNKEISKTLEDLGVNQGLFSTDNYLKSILQNNIYGVDLNEESVEITKLSLWLKTAQKGKKLANLDSNIKCGNSLIDDVSIAGDKAFNWETSFPQIFSQGGFDVVVGNPPYGATISKKDKDYYIENYNTAFYKLDTYSLFIEKSIHILKEKGLNAFIVPYTWLSIGQHKKLRELVLNNKINQIVDLPLKVFESADLDTVIYILSKTKTQTTDSIKVFNIIEQNFILKGELDLNYINKNPDLLINLEIGKGDLPIIEKIKNNVSKLGENFKVSQGLIPYDKYRGHTTEQVKGRVFHSNTYSEKFSKKELRGEDVSRYSVNPNNDLFINYGKHLAAPREKSFFTEPRILIREITRGNYYNLYSAFIQGEYYNTPVLVNIISTNNQHSLKYILTLLNSRLYTYFHIKSHSKAVAKTSIPKILVGEIRNIPIKEISLEEQQPFIEKADFMLDTNKILSEKMNKFLNRLTTTFELEKLPKKIQNFYELEFSDFVKELKKKKVVLSLKDQDDWEEYFESYKKEVLEIKEKINNCDREIDEMVFDLYELSEEEREIVRGK